MHGWLATVYSGVRLTGRIAGFFEEVPAFVGAEQGADVAQGPSGRSSDEPCRVHTAPVNLQRHARSSSGLRLTGNLSAMGWQGWQRLGRSDYECVAEGAENRHAGSDSKGWRIAAARVIEHCTKYEWAYYPCQVRGKILDATDRGHVIRARCDIGRVRPNAGGRTSQSRIGDSKKEEHSIYRLDQCCGQNRSAGKQAANHNSLTHKRNIVPLLDQLIRVETRDPTHGNRGQPW